MRLFSPRFVGNCKVEIHGSGLRCESTAQGLTVSGPRGAKVLISGTLFCEDEHDSPKFGFIKTSV